MERQILETVKKQITLKDKVHLIAETLRNCNLEQGKLKFAIKEDGKEKFCAYGALGFMAGIPKDVLKTHPYIPILTKYGITESEARTMIEVPKFSPYMEKEMCLRDAIWYMNDQGMSFNGIANWLDNQ